MYTVIEYVVRRFVIYADFNGKIFLNITIMKLICIAAALLVLSALLSCNEQPKKIELPVINLNAMSAINDSITLNLDDLGWKEKLIPLETNDSCLIADIKNIQESRNNYWIVSNGEVLKFDKQGRFDQRREYRAASGLSRRERTDGDGYRRSTGRDRRVGDQRFGGCTFRGAVKPDRLIRIPNQSRRKGVVLLRRVLLPNRHRAY